MSDTPPPTLYDGVGQGEELGASPLRDDRAVVNGADKSSPPQAASIPSAEHTLPDQIAAVMSHKWLDPECAWGGCQTLVLKRNLEAVVKAADWLSVCAQTTGGTAGPDKGLQDAIEAYARARGAA